jgi:dihydroflavonol-4-reductase
MRALVVGGTGFVGLHVVDELLAHGAQVRATRRRSSPTMLLRKRPVELVDASLEDAPSLARAMRGADVVFVCAAHYPRYSVDVEATVHVGVTGLRNALDAALEAGVARLVYTSSTGVLTARADGAPADERDVAPAMPAGSAYRAVKWAMEREVDAARGRGLAVTSLVVGGCIGPWDLRLGTNGLLAAVAHRAFPWFVDGWINVLDVQDAACAHVAALRTDAPRVCVAGHSVRFGELLHLAARRMGVEFDAPRVSVERARELSLEAEIEAQRTRARVVVPRELVDLVAAGTRVSNELAERELGIVWTPLEEALDRAHEWLVRFRYAPRPGPRPKEKERCSTKINSLPA